MLNKSLCLMHTSQMIKIFQVTSFEIVVYPTLPKENPELYFLFLNWELGSVNCESSFCASVNRDNISQIKIHVISESPTTIHAYSTSPWQAVSSKVVQCFQLLVEGACRQAQCSDGHS